MVDVRRDNLLGYRRPHGQASRIWAPGLMLLVTVLPTSRLSAQCACAQVRTGTNDLPLSAEAMPLYVAPFIEGHGSAVAFHIIDQSNLCDTGPEEAIARQKPGIPFPSPNGVFRLRLGVWPGGTIIWDAGKDQAHPEYRQGQVPSAVVQAIIAGGFSSAKRDPAIDRRSAAAVQVWSFVSSIGFVREDDAQVLYSAFDTMRGLNEKWEWSYPGGQIKEYGQLTEAEYRDAVPVDFRRYMEEWDRRKRLLWSVIPKAGEEIDLARRLQWIAARYCGVDGRLMTEDR